MSLCDKANCFFSLLFLIQIGLSKSEGKPRATALDAARDTGSYLPHCVHLCLQMTLHECVLHLCADSSILLYIVLCDNQSLLFLIASQWNLPWLIGVSCKVVCYGPCRRTWWPVHYLDNCTEQSENRHLPKCCCFYCTVEMAACSRLPLSTCNVCSCSSFYHSVDDEVFYRWFDSRTSFIHW